MSLLRFKMYILACVIALAFFGNAESMKPIRVKAEFEGHIVAQDITDNPEENTVLIVVGESQDFEDFKTSVNLHDFNTGFVALKSVTDGVCLLKPLYDSKREHIPGENSVIKANGEKFITYRKTMYWYKDQRQLSNDEIEKQAGRRIADFCSDYKTFNLIPKLIDTKSLSSQPDAAAGKRRFKRCSWACGWCFNEVDGYSEDVIDMDYKGN